MKVGVTYNIFNGEELLEYSILSIRNVVDYVGVVYQTLSNFNNPASDNLLRVLNELKDKHLIDELYEYEPDLKLGGKGNEIIKRNIGLDMARKVGCNYHMTMDSDEIYKENEFVYMKNEMIKNNYDSSACKMLTYYKTPEYMLYPPEKYYVSTLHKLNENTKYILGGHFPVLVDPSRRVKSGKFRLFNTNEIQMHHMSYVRKDISSKFNNASAKINYRNKINELIEYYNKWKYPSKALVTYLGYKIVYHDVKKVKPLFMLK